MYFLDFLTFTCYKITNLGGGRSCFTNVESDDIDVGLTHPEM